MAARVEQGDLRGVLDGLRRFGELPEWLQVAGRPYQVCAALREAAPEFASGELSLLECGVKRLRLKDERGRWTGRYHLTVQGPAPGQTREVTVRGTLYPPNLARGQGYERQRRSLNSRSEEPTTVGDRGSETRPAG